MILQEEQIVISVGSMVFTSHAIPGPHYRLDEAAIEGWYDGTGMRRDEETRTTGWGNFETVGWPKARLITVTGTAVADSIYMLQAMRDEFMATLLSGGHEEMEVWTTSTDSRFIRLAMDETKPEWVRKTDTFATFKIEFIADDPRIYGRELSWTFPGVGFNSGLDYPITYPLDYGVDDPYEIQNVQNDGNAEAWPIISVQGFIPDGFRITNGAGSQVVYTGPVMNMQPVVLDFARGTAKMKNSDRTSMLSSRNWFSIPPHKYIRPQLSYLGTGQGWMDVKIRDTWI